MQFSGAIKLGGGLDDYLTPAQNCVLPLIQTTKSDGTKVSMSNTQDNDPLQGLSMMTSTNTTTTQTTSTPIPQDVPGSGFGQIKTTDGDKASITLADCLSCSGCVTTAESILIAQHSSTHLLSILNTLFKARNTTLSTTTTTETNTTTTTNNNFNNLSQYDEVVVSISLPSLLSISTLLNTTPTITYQLLTIWFQSFGINRVIFALDSQLQVLHTASLEFEARFRNLALKYNFQLPSTTFQPIISTSQQSSQSTSEQLSTTPKHLTFATDSIKSSILPLLASECPGWVCLSEKTQGEKMIPFMSALRSPQAILGIHAKSTSIDNKSCSIDKDNMNDCGEENCCNNNNNKKLDYFINPRIFHVSIQPCYDKKLEATRETFDFNTTNTSQCCQSTTTSTTSNTESTTTGCCQDGTNNTNDNHQQQHQHHHNTTPIPYVDLVLSTHELADMLVNNIMQVEGLEQVSLPDDINNDTTSSTTTSMIELTSQIVSDLWIDLWSQYSQQQTTQFIPTNQLYTTFATTNKNSTSLTIPQINSNTTTNDTTIYRVPGLNTSSGGYAETALIHTLENIFQLATIPQSIHSLEWTPVTNNDLKAVLVEYLGSGIINDNNNNNNNDDKTEYGIYSIVGKNGTILTHGPKLNQICTATPTTTTKPIPTKMNKIKMSLDDDEFDFPMKKSIPTTSQSITTTSHQKLNDTELNNTTTTETNCNCVNCCPMFKMNPIKYKQIKNKTITYTTLSTPNPTTTTQKQSTSTITPATTTTIVKKSISLDDDDDFGLTKMKKSTPITTPISTTSSTTQSTLSSNTIITSSLSFSTQHSITYTITTPLTTPVCVFSACAAFGLRNVQAIIQQQTPSKLNSQTVTNMYHYVEVMSCPSGCTNGGAQLTTTQIKATRNLINTALSTLSPPQQESSQPQQESTEQDSQPIVDIIGTLPIDNSREAQITLQKAHLTTVQAMYEALPCKFSLLNNNNTTSTTIQSTQLLHNWIQQNALNLLFTKFNPIVANEQLQALRW